MIIIGNGTNAMSVSRQSVTNMVTNTTMIESRSANIGIKPSEKKNIVYIFYIVNGPCCQRTYGRCIELFKVEAKNLLENTDTHILHHTLA